MKIVFYVGISWQRWDPSTVAINGSGGSEVAVIELSKLFVKAKNEVVVYGDLDNEGIHDGVSWKHYSKFKNVECDILISSRVPNAINPENNIKYKLAYLWMHDANLGNWLNNDQINEFKSIIALTKWHKGHLLDFYKMDPDKIRIINNGIDPKRYKNKSITRNPHKAIYCSSPTRGLDLACNLWQYVRKEIPDAELHVYYGFDVVDIAARNKPDELLKIRQIKQLISETPGVILHGRLNQEQLANEQLSAGVLAYPTFFYETSCISAMEAKAAGVRIVTTALGALNETVGEHGVLLTEPYGTKDYNIRFIKSVCYMMTLEDQEDRKILSDYALKNLTWKKRSIQWLKMIKEDLNLM